MHHILFIDDDLAFSPLVKEFLETNQLTVDWFPHSDTGLASFSTKQYDLCLLDVNMPNRDGFSIAGEIRKKAPLIPIIFLTGLSGKTEKLQGFGLGADDYITKPMSLELLLARIKAVLRRYNHQQTQEQEEQSADFSLGQFRYQHTTRELSHPSGTVKLSAKESKLLETLVRKQGSLLSRDEALLSVWGDNDYSKGMSMNVYISKLRKLLSPDPAIHLLNVHGEGYILNVDS